MKTTTARTALFLCLTALAGGCDEITSERPAPRAAPAPPAKTERVKVGPNVYLEVQGKQRRVLVSSRVCLREGQLELLMTRKDRKEHEAILSADVDGRDIHQALILAGATEGSPVRFVPKYTPATGQAIQVSLRYKNDKGKEVVVPARSWVRNMKTGKELGTDWVFAGSQLIDNPLDKSKPKIYLANEGDLICVSNFETALLDLPIKSPKDNADLAFDAFKDRIPPVGTTVVVILEPIPSPKKK